MNLIALSLRSQPQLTLHIMLDYFRASRETLSKSSLTLLAPLLHEFPNRVFIALYHTPHNHGLLKRILPPRVDEGIGTMHMKVYAVDSKIILTGYDLSNFTYPFHPFKH